MQTGDRIIRAYARLKALREALAAEPMDRRQFPAKYVREYHDALAHLTESGFQTDEFRIPGEEVAPRVTGGNYLTGEVDYSADEYVDRSLFFAKLDAVLGYFDLVTAQPNMPKPLIGFRGPGS